MSALPRSLERLLAEAAEDPSLKEALLADRLAAARARGHQLSASEEKVLLAVPDEQLAAMVDRLAGARPEVDPPVFTSQGIRPAAPTGIRPDQTLGIRPDLPKDHDWENMDMGSPVRGTRPGGRRLLLTAAAATVVTAGAAGAWLLTAGVRPDAVPPPITEPVRSEEDRADAGPPVDAGPPAAPRAEEPPEK